MSILNTVRWINWRLKAASGKNEFKSLNVKSNRQMILETIASFAPLVEEKHKKDVDNDGKTFRNNLLDEIIERKINEIFERTLESRIEEKLCNMTDLLCYRIEEQLNTRNKKPTRGNKQ